MSLWAELRRLLRAWWKVDRIRASPREGRLLRIRPGDLVAVRGVAAEVLARHELPDAAWPSVAYDCRTADGAARMTVRFAARQRAETVEWTENGSDVLFSEAEVEVFLRPPAEARLTE